MKWLLGTPFFIRRRYVSYWGGRSANGPLFKREMDLPSLKNTKNIELGGTNGAYSPLPGSRAFFIEI
ncbi:hypothetical protein A3844_06500 [Paenibacillus helianthi]|uniref:Uncharacterized protein n=1 Tax=Paenibacillus helianthi TaxID=1349432 RepID=A0ABX3EUJ2_9BACL|nr:hypothetical protein A3844_06500 [Paenibacillus helianthi]OKP93752.1 hypothetical protein A3848_04415 [Paenibacillus sp. P32E]